MDGTVEMGVAYHIPAKAPLSATTEIKIRPLHSRSLLHEQCGYQVDIKPDMVLSENRKDSKEIISCVDNLRMILFPDFMLLFKSFPRINFYHSLRHF